MKVKMVSILAIMIILTSFLTFAFLLGSHETNSLLLYVGCEFSHVQMVLSRRRLGGIKEAIN